MKQSFDEEFIFSSLRKADQIIQLYINLKEPQLITMALTQLLEAYKKLFEKELGTANVTLANTHIFVEKISSLVKARHAQSFIDVVGAWEKYVNSTTQFFRKGALVVCDDDFNMHALTIEDLQLWSFHTKQVAITLFEANNND
ncbi:MAG: hypothetical protein ACOCQQ_00310 [Candidatus Nanoarchaeia archaeon]